MLVDSLWCDGRERRTKFSSACAFAHGRWEFCPVSLGNEKISYYDTSDIIVKSILFFDWFSIHGFILESKWFFDFYSCFYVFLCIISYFYAFIFVFMHYYAFLLL